jgi:hypothetical protein
MKDIDSLPAEVIFPEDGESFADFLQRQAPKGWTIRRDVRTRYTITTNDGLTAIVSRKRIGWRVSRGWKLNIHDTGIAEEFTVHTPDGRRLWFHTCWNP